MDVRREVDNILKSSSKLVKRVVYFPTYKLAVVLVDICTIL